jgi:hypothetical protein
VLYMTPCHCSSDVTKKRVAFTFNGSVDTSQLSTQTKQTICNSTIRLSHSRLSKSLLQTCSIFQHFSPQVPHSPLAVSKPYVPLCRSRSKARPQFFTDFPRSNVIPDIDHAFTYAVLSSNVRTQNTATLRLP